VEVRNIFDVVFAGQIISPLPKQLRSGSLDRKFAGVAKACDVREIV
jgi:hypothetical protein